MRLFNAFLQCCCFLWLGLVVMGCPKPLPPPAVDAGEPQMGIQKGCTPKAEICNNQDDDCNGVIDENCPCQDKTVRQCYTGSQQTLGVGNCSAGVQECFQGKWSKACKKVVLPQPEQCNGDDDNCDGKVDEDVPPKECKNACGVGTQPCQKGAWGTCSVRKPEKEKCNNQIDDDCDGVVDEECPCNNGDKRPCYTGFPATRNVGACQEGVQVCFLGKWRAGCAEEVKPKREVCNGIDDNCNGTVDDGVLARSCQTPCQSTGSQACQKGKWSDCRPANSAKETCNGIDDNCDGTVDEGCNCKNGTTQACGLSQGECKTGTQTCSGGTWSRECVGQNKPSQEVCNNKDDDCNGKIDDALPPRPCQTACGKGQETCQQGQWGGCTAQQVETEICNNKDDDCNGKIDDGVTRPCRTACGAGIETCRNATWKGCTAPAPQTEVCNNKDDDCNGKIDDNLGTTSCGIGGCANTVRKCDKGKPVPCKPLPPASEEYCGNGIDDDCNGKTDDTCTSCLPNRIVQLLSPTLLLQAQRDAITDIAFSPNGKILATASIDNTVKLWEWPSLKLIRTDATHSKSVTSVAISPDSKLLATASVDKTVVISNLATGQTLYTLRTHTDGIRDIAFSPDGTLLATASLDKTTKVWLFRGGTFPTMIPTQAASVFAVAFSPNGKFLATASGLSIALWSLPQGKRLRSLSGHKAGVTSIAFSPDSKLVVTSSSDDTVRVWDVAQGTSLRTLQGHSSAVNRVAISPDGKFVASVSNDNEVRLWDLQTGRRLSTMLGHSDWVQAVAFSIDGKSLATGSDDKSIRIWGCPVKQCSNPSLKLCNGVCVDTQSNLLHCGQCGSTCQARGQICINGKCTCPAGQTPCNGVCVNLRNNWKQCGACNNQCPNGKQKCVNGKCTSGCPSSLTLCNGLCFNTQTSLTHCGGCGKLCKGICCAGTCYPATSTLHCVTCNNRCPTGASCNRFCECPPGQYACGGKCTNLLTDPNNCTICGNKCPGPPSGGPGVCQQGICK